MIMKMKIEKGKRKMEDQPVDVPAPFQPGREKKGKKNTPPDFSRSSEKADMIMFSDPEERL